MPEIPVGKVTHHFGRIGVAMVKLTAPFPRGYHLLSRKIPDFMQTVESMWIEHQAGRAARPAMGWPSKQKSRVREGDKVYKIIP